MMSKWLIDSDVEVALKIMIKVVIGCTHTHAHAHIVCTTYRWWTGLVAEENSSVRGRRVCFWEKNNNLRLDLKESREEEEGHSTCGEAKDKSCRNQQWRVWCEESGGWEYPEQSREYVSVCKVEDSHRHKTEQCLWYIYNWECLSCATFSVGLEVWVETTIEKWYTRQWCWLAVFCVQEYKSRVNEVSANEEQLMQLNSSLKEQISALVTQHDLDKQQAVER